MPTIRFYTADFSFKLKGKNKIKNWIKECFENEMKKLSALTYVFCSDGYLLNINKQFLNHDYYTDVITFNLSENPDEIIGEVYISIERITENAKKAGVSINNELLRIIVHGALHLCGYSDKKKLDKEKMTRKENFYLKRAMI